MILTTFRDAADYWNRKLAFYLHDPPDKALAIPGHEERARGLRELFHLPAPDEGLWQRADGVASGLDRAWLPGYDPATEKSGAVDFCLAPKLTHPVSLTPAMNLAGPLPEAKEIFPVVQEKFQEAQRPLEEAFPGQPARLAPARFHLVHHALREILARTPEARLGGLWLRLPADTRLPDHSIWQHCALTSALATCYAESPQRKASLLVFSLTPVQDFLLRARKLRDFWTGSLLLSWLAFEGIRQVIYYLGSDHVLYPSLVGQPLVNGLLNQECGIPKEWLKPQPEDAKGVATLPNKFVCLVPGGREGEVAEKIKQGIQEAWESLGQGTLKLVTGITQKADAYVKEQFARQFKHFWDLHWAAAPLLEDAAQESFRVLLPETVWKPSVDFRQKAKGRELKYARDGRGEEGYYGPSHALVQAFLAAGKTRREDYRPPEPGIKCDLYGDLEILRYEWRDGDDKNPRPARDPFWAREAKTPATQHSFKANWQPASDFKDSERLSAVGLTKRIAYRITQENTDHPLRPFFAEADRFPSTTEMALSDWLDRVEEKLHPGKILGENWRRDLANFLHDQEPEVTPGEREAADLEQDWERCRNILREMEREKDPPRIGDRYLAILAMDGDRLGRLVSGESLGARWETVIHPELAKKLPEFPQEAYQKFWEEFLSHPRLLAPQVHAAISEALADFSLHTVPAIIERHRGRLIYAGGDDVCAVLPVSRALTAAWEIAQAYGQVFLFQEVDQSLPQPLAERPWQPQPGRLLMHLGPSHTISAAVLLCHHKKPLAAAMRRCQELLKLAKNEGDRNALAMELDRRAGGHRRFICQWDEKPWSGLTLPDNLSQRPLPELFLELAHILGSPESQELSASLLYRLEELRPGLEALAQEAPGEMVTFIASQVWRSRRKASEESESQEAKNRHHAALLAALTVREAKNKQGEKDTKVQIQTEPLILARFLGIQRQRAGLGQEVSHG